MGCTVREKHIRANRRTRSASKPVSDSVPKPESDLKPLTTHVGVQDPNNHNNSNCNCINYDENGWGYCTEEQLEEILLRNLDLLYKEAISKLVSSGYDEDVALKAVLRNGHCCGGMDILSNILHNALAFLNGNGSDNGGSSSSTNSGNGSLEELEHVFNDLRQLEEYSLAGLVCMLQQVRPNLSKGDAMWCLLMSNLHLGTASTIELPVANSSGNGNGVANASLEGVGNGGFENGVGMIPPALSKFHGGWGFGNGEGPEFAFNGFLASGGDVTLQRDIECPKRFNLSPSMKSLLKRNVAMFAAGFRASSKQMQVQSQPQFHACMGGLTGGDIASVVAGENVAAEKSDESHRLNQQDGVSSMLSKFRELKLDENLELGDDQKDEMIATLIHQIKDLEKQVKERKEWAHQKAMQAARKLSNDLTELKMLRMEREETQRLKKGKQTLDDATMKKLSEMENALRKASGQVDRANAAVRRLETENAEIRAEMEASKLSASESISSCLAIAKKEKKCLKKLLAWEKQKSKLQDEIAYEKEKIEQLRQALTALQEAQKEAETKWREEMKAKEQAAAQVEEERRVKEAAEASNKRKLEALRLKVEIDFQRHKDDLQRLEQELSRLKSSAESTELNQPSSPSPQGVPGRNKRQGETIASLLNELTSSEKESNCDRECMICMKDEVSVVFLPCAHQVMCANCNENYGKKGKATCPCCSLPIEQRIRVFGASS